jgi:hypothetical protein
VYFVPEGNEPVELLAAARAAVRGDDELAPLVTPPRGAAEDWRPGYAAEQELRALLQRPMGDPQREAAALRRAADVVAGELARFSTDLDVRRPVLA